MNADTGGGDDFTSDTVCTFCGLEKAEKDGKDEEKAFNPLVIYAGV